MAAAFVETPTSPRDLEHTAGRPASASCPRVRVEGKFLALGPSKWYVRGLTYGPFAPNALGEQVPPRPQTRLDLKHVQALGANAVRLYHPPPIRFLDDVLQAGVRALIDLPWDKHRCFFEDWQAVREARKRVRESARELGRHPGVLAISVANEIPKDIVRFYGARRIEKFLSELLDVGRQQAPQCLFTYTNYPSTEFLRPEGMDLYCANVYLHNQADLQRYLMHLQHVAGNLPLVLGEFGIDSLREGPDAQARILREHIETVFRGGLAGSFIFSYTDEWFTGGEEIHDWAFGITDRSRQPKPAAAELSRAWTQVPCIDTQALPRVSVLVCSYNGRNTLHECLDSLIRQDYPDYEVILLDDGSTDDTPEIAARFPTVRYIRQKQLGLSAARNRAAHEATGKVVAYTDSDCVADPTWLKYLVSALVEQQLDGIGGPNVTPPSDRWVAKCVSASPGNPSHVMFDDRHAEHIPGCNMAFWRDRLLALGGFDVQFRQAGDDVDFCWRMLDAGMRIGYAPAALVWHHRRPTLRAFWRQQRGYGRAEAMLQFKHPERFSALGSSRWNGVIYGEGAVGLALARPKVFHGAFGQGLFQIVYRGNQHSPWAYFTLLEWHAIALAVLVLSIALPQLAVIAAALWALSIASAVRSAWYAPLDKGAPLWCRPLVFLLNLAQPAARAWYRYAWRIARVCLPVPRDLPPCESAFVKRVSRDVFDLDWESDAGIGREALLTDLVQRARGAGWLGEYAPQWKPLDLDLIGDRWHTIRIHTATEELGGPRRFTRVRTTLRPTRLAFVICAAGALLLTAAVAVHPLAGFYASFAASAAFALQLWRSHRRCRDSILRLIRASGMQVGLRPVCVQRESRSCGFGTANGGWPPDLLLGKSEIGNPQ